MLWTAKWTVRYGSHSVFIIGITAPHAELVCTHSCLFHYWTSVIISRLRGRLPSSQGGLEGQEGSIWECRWSYPPTNQILASPWESPSVVRSWPDEGVHPALQFRKTKAPQVRGIGVGLEGIWLWQEWNWNSLFPGASCSWPEGCPCHAIDLDTQAKPLAAADSFVSASAHGGSIGEMGSSHRGALSSQARGVCSPVAFSTQREGQQRTVLSLSQGHFIFLTSLTWKVWVCLGEEYLEHQDERMTWTWTEYEVAGGGVQSWPTSGCKTSAARRQNKYHRPLSQWRKQ